MSVPGSPAPGWLLPSWAATEERQAGMNLPKT
jgi:hypothetical protein